MATFADLEADNPDIRRQYQDWLQLRLVSGEDPADYQAFRQHVLALGAPDPGDEQIEDFTTPAPPPSAPSGTGAA
jgi:hypothetical protein